MNAAGKMPIDLERQRHRSFSISGHKFHGPKGIGALYIRDGVELPPFLIGGGQEAADAPEPKPYIRSPVSERPRNL